MFTVIGFQCVRLVYAGYLPTDFIHVRLPGTRSYLQDTGDGFPTVRHAPGDVLQWQLVVEQVDGAALTPQGHVVVRRVVGLRRTAPEQFRGTVVERRTIVQAIAAQIARFFHCNADIAQTNVIIIILFLNPTRSKRL